GPLVASAAAVRSRPSSATGPTQLLTQFIGPVHADWLSALTATGATIVAAIPDNAFIVYADGPSVARVEALAALPFVQYVGPYRPEYRLEPSLAAMRQSSAPVPVTIQFVTTPATQQSIARLSALGATMLAAPFPVRTWTNVVAAVPGDALATIAGWPDVFNVEPWTAPRLMDEALGQIVAGNVTRRGGVVAPTGPGYLAWLASHGFPADPAAYPPVAVTDDGVDNGTDAPLDPAFRVLGDPAAASRIAAAINCTDDPVANGVAGHGAMNAAIVAAYNAQTGSPHVDANGFIRGLGVNPFGRVVNVKVFQNDRAYSLARCRDLVGMIERASAAGAPIGSHSWGMPLGGAYDATAQAFDALTRDAQPRVAGNQPMLHIVAAGNFGPSARTIASPATAKNVIAVGATENVRDHGVLDGCQIHDANSADDAASFSSRGPTRDGRGKPDLVAPGVHVAGPASRDPGYTGTGVCGAYPNTDPTGPNRYYPANQTIYTWSSGTSRATPAVAGAAALVANYYTRVIAPGQVASPAMIKALLVNGARYLVGVGTGDTLPSATQGWGGVQLAGVFDGQARVVVDQTRVFTATGQVHQVTGVVADPTKPLRVTLAWTDAPGATTAAATVNDLDLEVTVGGQVYRGNWFNGAYSLPNGQPDPRNNVEQVVVPPGVAGPVAVRVIARNIVGRADPQHPAEVNQDFALVVANAIETPTSALSVVGHRLTEAIGDGDGSVGPGETAALDVSVRNDGQRAFDGARGVLSLVRGPATIVRDTATFAAASPGGVVTSTTPYLLRWEPRAACGESVTVRHTIESMGATAVATITLPIGPPVTIRAVATDATPIPDNAPVGARVAIPVETDGVVTSVVVRVAIAHPWPGDLSLRVVAPTGATALLAHRRGGDTPNIGDPLRPGVDAVFDDIAPDHVATATPPLVGPLQPETPLRALVGGPARGVWLLIVTDGFPGDTGQVVRAALEIGVRPAACGDALSRPTPTDQRSDVQPTVTNALHAPSVFRATALP
ncbi:MAG: S8 family serine peptidase, partial [Dehalococcoidia bacterium]|nr:S8 family serine peptidase [Dehalococcoidia bacterium]